MKGRVILLALAMSLVLVLLGASAAFAQDPTALSGEKCMACHKAAYDEWAGTAHAHALKTLVDSGHGSDRCLPCHSVDYILAAEGAKPTLTTAQYSVGCLACHGDHTAGGTAAVANVYDTCAKCHNGTSGGTRPITAGAEAHHPMQEMFEGTAAPDLTGTPSKHLTVKDCNNCHVEGHKYEATQAACDKCHAGKATIAAVHAEFTPIMEKLKADLDAAKAANPTWDVAATTKDEKQVAYEKAFTYYTIVDSEGSMGVHNKSYATAIVTAAQDALVKVGLASAAAATTAAPATLPTTGAALPFLPLALAGAGLVIAGLGMKRRG